ncbi:CBS domain-containing protein [Angustibacter sp. Root456]|uniref:CBS domain-containing protein n=1 Tax=Angustibacter sp. Root456 TaxID=1736539 RepID=UPI0006F2D305|nr:CBS domain-containing protein [Angustibacter sp. Root456]KQX61558.1 histidine kinase [Angustibacter sp. Root456]
MRISDVIRRKGAEVVTIKPDDTVRQLLDLLAQHRIGALVVSPDGSAVAGIVSERDVVRHLQRAGADVLDSPVAQIMTAEVTTCGPDDGVEHLMRLMTDQRVRHIPVVIDGVLHGIVSIGDVVKHRIDELQSERDQLVGYINQ